MLCWSEAGLLTGRQNDNAAPSWATGILPVNVGASFTDSSNPFQDPCSLSTCSCVWDMKGTSPDDLRASYKMSIERLSVWRQGSFLFTWPPSFHLPETCLFA